MGGPKKLVQCFMGKSVLQLIVGISLIIQMYVGLEHYPMHALLLTLTSSKTSLKVKCDECTLWEYYWYLFTFHIQIGLDEQYILQPMLIMTCNIPGFRSNANLPFSFVGTIFTLSLSLSVGCLTSHFHFILHFKVDFDEQYQVQPLFLTVTLTIAISMVNLG